MSISKIILVWNILSYTCINYYNNVSEVNCHQQNMHNVELVVGNSKNILQATQFASLHCVYLCLANNSHIPSSKPSVLYKSHTMMMLWGVLIMIQIGRIPYITLFKFVTMFCGADNIPRSILEYSPHSVYGSK